MNQRTLTKRRPPAKETPSDVTQVLASAASPASASIDDEDTRRQLIAVEAYFLAERRGFTPGCELDDWLAAEAIVEGRFRGTSTSGQANAAGRAPSLA